MWEFTDIRERAIRELSEDKDAAGPIDKIERGKHYDVNQWVMEGYVELLKRAETITNEEAEYLGWKTAAKLLLVREQYLASIMSQWSNGNPPTSNSCNSCGSRYYCGICGSNGGYRKFTSRDQYDFTTTVKRVLEIESETTGDQI